MTIYFNSSTNFFYDSAIHDIIPEGSVEVSEEHRQSLLSEINPHQSLGSNKEGLPIILTRTQPHSELCEMERSWRDSELVFADTQIHKIQDGNKTAGRVSEWRQYRNLLREWPASPDFPSKSQRPRRPNKEQFK